MDTYIIRIYRQNPDEPRKLVGLVEEAGVEGKRGFASQEELWGILNPDNPRKPPLFSKHVVEIE
jgi:hypothetical protein